MTSRGSSRRALATVTVALIAAAGVSACGSSSSSSSSSSGSGSGTTTAATSAGQTSNVADLSSVLKYVGVKSAAASSSKTPVTLGWINQDGGYPASPEATVAAKATVSFINQKLGGVDGHPLKLDYCSVSSSDTQGQQCAEQFLADHAIVGVSEAAVNVGAPQFQSTINGKLPVVEFLSNSVQPLANTYALTSGSFGYTFSAPAYVGKDLHAKTTSIVGDQSAITAILLNLQKSQLVAQGIKVSLAYYPASATDLTTALTAAKASSTDATFGAFITSSECISGAKALQQLAITKPVLVNASACYVPQLKEALGDYPKWDYVTPIIIPGTPDTSGQSQAFLQMMAAYAPKGAVTGGFAPYAFLELMTELKELDKVAAKGAVTAKAFGQGMATFQGSVFMGPPKLTFDQKGLSPQIGTLDVQVIPYDGNGKWGTPSGWIAPATAAHLPSGPPPGVKSGGAPPSGSGAPPSGSGAPPSGSGAPPSGSGG
jgi:branched-chain amino acid transport system substrate-binding protein